MQAGAGPWRALNRWLYGAAHLLAARDRGFTARWRRALAAAPAAASAGPVPVVYLAGGRLGDALLAAAWTRHYRAWFGRPVIAVGRPETEPVVAPLVDRFVPFDRRAPWHGPHGGAAVASALGGRTANVLGDLHLFHGNRELIALAAALATDAVLYDGWIERRLQAPCRPWPAAARVVPALPKAPGTDAERRHVWNDLAHYHRAALAHFGLQIDALPDRPWLPPPLTDSANCREFGLPDDYVACHAQSSQGKKDWPLAGWREVLAGGPRPHVVLLGAPRDRAGLHDLPDATDLRGRTSVAQALAIAANARAFVGVDSGLAHAAAISGVPTVVAMAAATPGYFFPYPRAIGADVQAVFAPGFAACAGCGGLCSREPLWQSRRCGLPCVRALQPALLAAALHAALTRGRRAVTAPG